TPIPQDTTLNIKKTATIKTITYEFMITNNGNVDVNTVKLTAALRAWDHVTCGDTTLAPGAATMCSTDHVVVPADIVNNSVTNKAFASAIVTGKGTAITSGEASVTVTPIASQPSIAGPTKK